MLLTIDVGNTNIVIGLFDGEELKWTSRMTTSTPRTSDEYGIFLQGLVRGRGADVSDVTDVAIASVVPDQIHSLSSGIIKYFGCRPLIVNSETRSIVKFPNKKEVGADRIVDADAAYRIYGGPVIICDFGTATTYDLVNDKGEFAAGVTALGMRSSAQAMHTMTAQLPEISIQKPDTILTLTTIESLQAGLVFGTVGEAEYIIRRLKKESGFSRAKVIATGGLGKIIAQETKMINIYDPELTTQGLRMLYEYNKKPTRKKTKKNNG